MFNRKSNSHYVLIGTTIMGLLLLPFAIYKRPFKDWVIVYLVSVLGNSFSDQFLVKKGFLKYKKKLVPGIKIHLPFDFIFFPLMLLYYNQWTLNSKLSGLILKIVPIVIPQVLLETLAARRTQLISWKKGWNWYHSFISVVVKMWLCRSIIGSVRLLNKKKTSIN